MRDIRLHQELIDLTPDLITAIKDRDRARRLALQPHARHVRQLLLVLLARLLPHHLDAVELAVLEEGRAAVVRAVLVAARGPRIAHEQVVRLAVDAERALEGGDVHFACLEEAADLAPDLVAVFGRLLASVVPEVDFLARFVGGFAFVGGRRL